jgi:hypothetical protein
MPLLGRLVLSEEYVVIFCFNYTPNSIDESNYVNPVTE